MKTLVKKNGDTIVVSIDGKLDYEGNIPLRDNLTKLIKENKTDSVAKKIIVNLEGLEFVGSSGISSFIQTLRDFNTTSEIKPRYCNVRSEFRRMIKAFGNEEAFDFYENEERAKKSFDN